MMTGFPMGWRSVGNKGHKISLAFQQTGVGKVLHIYIMNRRRKGSRKERSEGNREYLRNKDM